MKNILGKVTPTVAAVAAATVLSAGGGAYAAVTHLGKDSVTSWAIKDGGVKQADLAPWVQRQIGKAGTQGPAGEAGQDGQTGPQGPKGDPGLSNVTAGADYSHTWPAHSGKQTIVSQCPEGQYAISGGFSTFGGDRDLGGDNQDIQVTVSAPFFEGDYKPVDDAGDFRPTEWVIEGFNNGDKAQVVRGWVVCANARD